MRSSKYKGEMGFLQKELGRSGGGGTCAFGSRDKEKTENNHFSSVTDLMLLFPLVLTFYICLWLLVPEDFHEL